MAKRQKIVIMTAEEVAEERRKSRGRAIFREMLENGQYKAKRFDDKKRKALRKLRKKEDRRLKEGCQ